MIRGNKGQSAGPLQQMIIGLILIVTIAGLAFVFLSELSSEYDVTLQDSGALQAFSQNDSISAIISDTQQEFVGSNTSQQVDVSGSEDTNIFRSALRISKVVMNIPSATMKLVNQAINVLVPTDLVPYVWFGLWSMITIAVLFGAIALILRWRG